MNGIRFKKVLDFNSLSQRAFAKQFDISQAKVSKMIAGKEAMPSTIAEGISERYGVSLDWLFGKIGNDDEIIFTNQIVSVEKYNLLASEKSDAMEELAKVYKRLAELERERADKTESQVKQLKND